MSNARCFLTALLAAVVLAPAACAEATTLQLTLAHATPPQSLMGLSAAEFARRANELLGERAHVSVYPAGQLGDDADVLQKLRLGTVDLALPSSVMPTAVPAFALFEMPYLVRDRAHVRLIADSIFWPELAPLAEAEGLRVLALYENGFRHVTNNVRPIHTPADLAGIKLRTPRNSWRVELFRELGANPSPMPFSELFMALQTGVMDGQENAITNVSEGSLHEVQTYLSLTRHVYSPAYLITGDDRWAELPGDVRQAIERAARETLTFVFEAAGAADERIRIELAASGMRINEVDRDAFVAASAPVYEHFESAVPGGRAWIARALRLGAESEAPPRSAR